MAKKDISKILTTGSIKQRLLLIAEDTAMATLSKGTNLLTDHEHKQLIDSIRKPNEIKLWKEFKEADSTVLNAIINLQGVKFEVLMNYSNLRGYILLWNAIENAELLVNSVLHEIKDTKERKKIAKNGAKGIDLLFSKTEPYQEGYIEIKTDFEKDIYKVENGKLLSPNTVKTKEYSLWYVMNNVKKEVENSVIKYLSWEKAILDYMDERGFNVKAYKDNIKEMTTQISRPLIGWFKYYGEVSTDFANPRLEEIIKKYTICTRVEDLEPSTKEYNLFRKNILKDEKKS